MMPSDQEPEVITRIREASKKLGNQDDLAAPMTFDLEFRYGDILIAGFSGSQPIPLPRGGDRVELHGHGPLIVKRVTTDYAVNEQRGGLDVFTDVEVVPEPVGRSYGPVDGEGRVRVKVLLGIGADVDITADAPDAELVQRYPADVVAGEAGVEVKDLPGMRLTARVRDDGRLEEFRAVR